MVSKVLLVEFERFKARVASLRNSLKETLEANKKKEIEYTEAKKQYQNEIRQIAKEHNCLDKNLSVLEREIAEYELKLKTSFAEKNKKEAEFNDYTIELGKLKEGISLMDKSYERKIQKLTDDLQNAKAKLKEQLKLEKQLEKNFCTTLQNKKNEVEDKVKNQQKSFEERFAKLEGRYSTKTEPLILYLQHLDADISCAEAELEQKQKDIDNLKRETKELEKKCEEASEARLMNETSASAEVLMKGLKYFRNCPEALTSDAILGILIVKANLLRISNRFHPNNSFSNKLESLLEKCNDIINLHHTESYPLFNKMIWNGAAEDLKWGNFDTDKYQYLLPNFDSCKSIDSYFMKGTPEDSDFCINELIQSDCEVSEKCWFSETNKKEHSGYKTSHRFLYFFVATKLQCDKKNADKFLNIERFKYNLCQRMLSEAQALFVEPHFALTKDLFMEYISLCGLEGYGEFAPYVWREKVRSWQSPKGCFGHDVDFRHCQINAIQKVDRKNEVKRTDTEVDSCHTHVTAVALSSLAFFLRFTVEGAFKFL